MNQFIRYLIYFLSITISLVILMILAQTFVYKETFKIGFMLVLIGAALIYSLGMAMYGSCASNPSILKVTEEVATNTSIDEYFANKKWFLEECYSDKKVYRLKNRYKAWVAGDITVYKESNDWFVSLPNSYAEEFNNYFKKKENLK